METIKPGRKFMPMSEQGVKEIVDFEQGFHSSALYTDQQIFDLEMENIFGKCWLLLGHESQIPEANDYITSKMGNDSVIVTRHRDGSIKAMLNQCRHRGIKLARGDFGNARSFTCSYHGWCFDTKGSLVSMPHSDHHGDCFKKEDWGLIEVPRLETYKGLIFANWDEEAEPLDDYLAEAKWYLDAMFDRCEEGVEFIGLQKWVVKGNWKWGAEQHVSDFYHAQVSHVSYKDVFMPGCSINNLKDVGEPEYGLQYSSPTRGHGAGWMTYPDDASLAELIQIWSPDMLDYFRNVQYKKVSDRLGETRGQKMAVMHSTIFPNFSMNRGQGYVRLWQPIGPNETEVWSFVIVDKDMPQKIKDDYLVAKSNVFSVTGCLEQDDTENTVAAQMGVTGNKAAQAKLNIMMGEKKQPPADFEGPGDISDEYSEVALRGYYRRYAELMANQD